MYAEKKDIQDYLGIAINNSLNDFVDGMIESGQDYVERYCGNGVIRRRKFGVSGNSEETKYYDGDGGRKLAIDDVQSVSKLVIDGVEMVDGDDYLLYPLNEKPKEWIELKDWSENMNSRSIIGERYPEFPIDEQKIVEVKGKFGYSDDVPKTIKMAVVRVASALIKENAGDTDLRELSSESLGPYSASFADVKDIANSISVHEMLESYKRLPLTKANYRKL